MLPPVTGMANSAQTTPHSTCSAVCVRISRWRRSQSSSPCTSVPGAGSSSVSSQCQIRPCSRLTRVTASGPASVRPRQVQRAQVVRLAAAARVERGPGQRHPARLPVHLDDRRVERAQVGVGREQLGAHGSEVRRAGVPRSVRSVIVAQQILDTAAAHGPAPCSACPGCTTWRSGAAAGRPRWWCATSRPRSTPPTAGPAAPARSGAAVVTTGPGAANAVAAFGEAAAAGSPVLLVASEIPQALRRPGPAARGAARVPRPGRALRAAGQGGVHPAHRRGGGGGAGRGGRRGAAAPARPGLPRRPGRRPGPAAGRCRQADGALARAWCRRPRSWTPRPRCCTDAPGGDLGRRRRGGRRARRWRRWPSHLGAPVVASFQGRGCPPTDHPAAVGLPPHEPEVAGADRGRPTCCSPSAATWTA